MASEDDYPLAPPPDELGTKLTELGEPLAEFAVRRRDVARGLIVATFLFLAGWGVIFVTLFFIQKIRATVIKIAIVGVILIVSAIAIPLRALRNRGLRILVYPDGIVRLHRDQTTTFFWDQVVAVRRQCNKGNWHKGSLGQRLFIVELASGQVVPFDDYLPRLDRLGQLIEEHTLPYLLPGPQARFNAGQTVEFGKLRLNQEGIAKDKENLSWSQVKSIDVGDALSITRLDKWRSWSVPPGEVPNIHVLLALANQALGRV